MMTALEKAKQLGYKENTLSCKCPSNISIDCEDETVLNIEVSCGEPTLRYLLRLRNFYYKYHI